VAERVLTRRELSWALLARQLLLGRARTSIPKSGSARRRRLGGRAWRPVDGRIELEPFKEIAPAARKEVDEEAARLVRFYARAVH